MKKITFFFALMFSTSLVISQNLITNGDLETGVFTPFESFSANKATINTNSANAYKGSNSINIPNQFVNLRQTFTATAGVTYQISFFFKYNNNHSDPDLATFSIRTQNGTNNGDVILTLSNTLAPPSNTTEYTFFSATFTPTSGQENLLLWMFKNAGGSSTATNNSGRLDNVSIRPLATWQGDESADWNTAGNWDINVVPTATNNDVLIPSSGVTNEPTISSTTGAEANNLEIDASRTLTIDGGGSLVVNDNASGNMTYTRTLVANKWHLVGSPVVGETYDDSWVSTNGIASGTGSNRGVSWYDNSSSDATTGHWRYMQSMGSGNFESSTGYGLIRTTGGTVSFIGTYPTGSKPAVVSNANTNKFNLLSNPYPTYLAVSEFFTDNATSKFTENTIWIWNQASGASGEYVPKTSASDGTFQIAPGQAFFISSGDGTNIQFYQFNGSSASDTFLKSNRTEVSISVNDGTNTKTTNLHYIESATNDFDNGYDASLFSGISTDFSIYTGLLSNNQKSLSRQVVSIGEIENTIIPVGVKATAGKELQFSADVINIPNGLKVFLEDREKGVFTQLDTPNSNYKITLSNNSNGLGRFYLHVKSSVLNTDDAFLNNVSIYKMNNSSLKVSGLQQGQASLEMFNILGKKLLKTSFKATGNDEINLPKVATGVYLVQLKTTKGKLTKKIILE